jgi:UDP-N-acetylglucosamine diphosphorylase/glucosamine-1-phosphate N-acetyltransferase
MSEVLKMNVAGGGYPSIRYFHEINVYCMQIAFFDDQFREDLFPFLMTRPAATLRCGVLTVEEKWIRRCSFQGSVRYITANYLSTIFARPDSTDCLLINGSALPDDALVAAVMKLGSNQQIVHVDRLVALRCEASRLLQREFLMPEDQFESVQFDSDVRLLRHPWDLFQMNDGQIRSDFSLVSGNETSQPLPEGNTLIGNGGLFIGPGARIQASVINTETGPVYIAAGAEVMEGTLIRGPFALGEQAVLKMGARIYGATTIGPGCKVGGEVSNSILLANSNKAHDGFLGNSVVGEWCNLGADTNNSNLKNNYSSIRVWNHRTNSSLDTGLQFCGLFMGDHSKCSINTMFNTGTVVDVFANVFGAGFPAKHIPSFSWGSEEGGHFMLDKALDAASRVMARRGRELSAAEREMLEHLYMSSLHPRAED